MPCDYAFSDQFSAFSFLFAVSLGRDMLLVYLFMRLFVYAFISALPQLNGLKPICPPFSLSQQFRNFAVPRSNLLKELCAAFSLSQHCTIEQAKAYSPSILFISAVPQFSSSAVQQFRDSTVAQNKNSAYFYK